MGRNSHLLDTCHGAGFPRRLFCFTGPEMKIKNSLKALMRRDRNNKLVRRRGRVYIINKKAPRYKARQG